MKRIKTSIVAWSGAAALASFAILYQILSYSQMLDVALSLAFGVSLAGVLRYLPDAARAFRSGRGGAEFLVVAVFTMMMLILVQRSWGIALRIYDRPDWLVYSPMTIFIPWMLAWAVSLCLIAPDIDDAKTIEGKKGIWKSVALFVSGALAGFVLSTSFQSSAVELSQMQIWPHLVNRAKCADDEDVWGSSNGVYHVENSPYRAFTYPKTCYHSVEDAERDGMRPPKAPGAGLTNRE